MIPCCICCTDYTLYGYTEDDLIDVIDLLKDEIIIACPDCAEDLVLLKKYEYA